MRRFVLLCLLFALVPSVGGTGRAAVTKGPIQYVTVDDGTKIAVSVYYPDRFDKTIGHEEELALENAVARRYPLMHDAQPRGGWASLYDVSPDWQPVIGEIADGVFVDAGTSGHGFKLAPALGRHVADLVLGRPDPRIAQFDPNRFEKGELLSAGYRDARILG